MNYNIKKCNNNQQTYSDIFPISTKLMTLDTLQRRIEVLVHLLHVSCLTLQILELCGRFSNHFLVSIAFFISKELKIFYNSIDDIFAFEIILQGIVVF